MVKGIDESLIKQAQLLLVDLYDSEIVGNISYDKKSYSLLEGRKTVLEIVCGKIIFQNTHQNIENLVND